ncbi:hypothetical protein ElP_22810 [Tautonia plasticadhaerens]|uniref:Uncharacterized protein n=1 Tax=Tautonia plasticadhaerens TaxID=2527974 RepID=A0A518H0M0_9BACT|nr:hypothetical protein ElP_22810 [Tautonia plasticadhaerens]
MASLGTERDVSEEEAEHVLNILLSLRDTTADAALGYSRALQRIDAMVDRVEPATGKAVSRQRRSRPRTPRV